MEFTFVQDMSFKMPYVQLVYSELWEKEEYLDANNYYLVFYNFENDTSCFVSVQPPSESN